MSLYKLPKSGITFNGAQLLSIDAVGDIEPLELDHYGFMIYYQIDGLTIEKYITNSSKENAITDKNTLVEYIHTEKRVSHKA